VNWALRPLIRVLDRLDKLGSSGSIHLTKITGKSPVPIHPKHLVGIEPYFKRELEEGEVILDVGCGNGMNLLKAAQFVKFAVGFDLDLDQLQKGRSLIRLKELGNVEFVFADAEMPPPFTDRVFDKILLVDVLEHLNNRTHLLRALSMLLKKDGMLILSIPNRDTRWKRMKRAAGLSSFAASDHKIEYDKASMERELETAGWEILSIEPVVIDTPWAGIMDLIGAISLSIYRLWQEWKSKKVKETPEETTGWRVTAVPLD